MNPRKLFARIFKRKQKLPRGLPLRKLDPHARRLVKQTDRHSAEHRKVATRLKYVERRKNFQFVLDVMAVCIVLASLGVIGFNAYVFVAPVDLIAHVSPEKARWVDSLRKSGCADSYAMAFFLSPIVDAESKFIIQNQYLDCARARMDFPA